MFSYICDHLIVQSLTSATGKSPGKAIKHECHKIVKSHRAMTKKYKY